MKKYLLPILFAIPTIVISQNIKDEQVNTSFLCYPKIDMSGMDITTLQADFCAGDIKIMSKNIAQETHLCKVEGGDAALLEIFFYKVNVAEPISFLRIRDKEGTVQYVAQTTSNATRKVEFGKNNCHWAEPLLKSAYEKEEAEFTAKSQKEAEQSALNQATSFLNGALTFTYVPQEFSVYYVKDKDGLYADLTKASETALAAYKELNGNSEDAAARGQLREAVTIWEKALTESNPELKDARINKKVSMILGENLGHAYLYLMDFEKARAAVKAALDLQKNVSTNSTVAREELLAEINTYKKGYDLNHALAVNTTAVKVSITPKPSAELAQFQADKETYDQTKAMADFKTRNKEYEAGVKSGKTNRYEKYLQDIAGGKMLVLPDLASRMTGGPDGEILQTFPEELTELSEVTFLMLRSNNLKTIPPSIGKMVNLKKMVLTNNQLTSLPAEMANLKELKTLVIKGNNISAEEVEKIQSLLPNCKIKQ